MNMKTTTILGIMLIVLGVVGFVYKGISYTTRENVIDVGPLQATVDKKEAIPLSPFVAGGHRQRHRVADRWSQESIARVV